MLLFLEILSHLNTPPPLKCCRIFLQIILIKSALRISSHGVGSAAIYVCSWAFVRKCIQMGLFLKLCMCMCIHIWLLTLYHGARYQGWHLLGSIEACSNISRAIRFWGVARFLEIRCTCIWVTLIIPHNRSTIMQNPRCTYKLFSLSMKGLTTSASLLTDTQTDR